MSAGQGSVSSLWLTVTLVLTSPLLLAAQTITVAIPATEGVGEGDGTVEVCATLSLSELAMTADPVNVILTTTDDSALAGDDYTALNSSSLMFAAGSSDGSMQCVDIIIMDDILFEGDETFTVALTVVTSGVMLGDDTTTVTITENEAPTVSIPTTVSVGEGYTLLELCATLDTATSIPVSVNMTTNQGSASAGADYSAINSEPLMFAAGSSVGAMECVNISIVRDILFEGDETFTVALTVVTSGVRTGGNVTTVTITDNESVIIAIPTTLSVGEGDGTVEVCATLFLLGSPGFLATTTPDPISVTLTTTNGSALAGADFTAISASPLVFAAGSPYAAMQCVDITIMEDTLFEEDETFTVGLTVVTSGVTTRDDTTTVTITENEGAAVSLPSMVSVGEGRGTVPVCATLSETGGGFSVTTIPINITFTTSDGSALAGDDYTALTSAVLEFPTASTGGSVVCANVVILDDTLFEGNETFIVRLTDTTPDLLALEGNNVTTVTITDNEDNSVTELTITPSKPPSILLGDYLSLNCSPLVSTEQELSFTWIHLDSSSLLQESSGLLTLPHVSLEQLGTYQCSVGSVSAYINITSARPLIEPGVYPVGRVTEGACPSSQETVEDATLDVLQLLASEYGVRPLGLARGYPAESCDQVGQVSPDSPSGMYWVSSGKDVVQVFCQF